MTTSKKTIVAAAAGVVALGAGLGIAGFASADPTVTPTPSSTVSPGGAPSDLPGKGGPGGPGGPGGHRGGPGLGDREGDLAKDLATKLGVTEAKATEALKAVRDDNRPTTKPTPGATPTPGQTRPDPSARDAELAKALAGKLGVDEAKVKTALDEIRTARQADRAAALKTKLDAAVKAGTLTQAEADGVQKAVEKGVIDVGPR